MHLIGLLFTIPNQDYILSTKHKEIYGNNIAVFDDKNLNNTDRCHTEEWYVNNYIGL